MDTARMRTQLRGEGVGHAGKEGFGIEVLPAAQGQTAARVASAASPPAQLQHRAPVWLRHRTDHQQAPRITHLRSMHTFVGYDACICQSMYGYAIWIQVSIAGVVKLYGV